MLNLMNYGFHRVLEPEGAIPQAALRVDNTPAILHPEEILIRVSLLNLDSTGMSQLRAGGGDIAQQILDIVARRGKMHNPVTNSCGVLVGEVTAVGDGVGSDFELVSGDIIIPVVSTSTLPLFLREVGQIKGDQVQVDGHAILFDGMGYSPLPPDFSLSVALSAIDISSIVPQVYRSVEKGQVILVIGAGKAGVTAMAAARKTAPGAHIIGLDTDAARLAEVEALGYAHQVISADARLPEQVLRKVRQATDGRGCDVVLNCVNVADTEAASILASRRAGTIIFYSMATRFDKAALGTDATDNDVRIIIGNGVAHEQARLVFELLREEPKLRDYFERHVLEIGDIRGY
jgi:L-erythro-3,5-diaminohexanoate dehydrogenase